MNTDKLKPTNIADIIFRIDEYLDCMRSQRQNAHELLDFLDQYIKDYFQALFIDKMELKTLTVKLVDKMYIKICQFATTDKYGYTFEKGKAFLKYQYKFSDCYLEDIERSFVHVFEHYLSTVEQLQNNTVMKYIRQTKTVLKMAMEMG